MKVSECCGARFAEPGWPDNDLCSACGEHTGAVDQDIPSIDVMEMPAKPAQPQIDYIKEDLLKVIDNLEALEQMVINLNHKVKQHIKKGHKTHEVKQNVGNRIVFAPSSDSGRGSIADN